MCLSEWLRRSGGPLASPWLLRLSITVRGDTKTASQGFVEEASLSGALYIKNRFTILMLLHNYILGSGNGLEGAFLAQSIGPTRQSADEFPDRERSYYY
jgi:hypothetical protein